MTTIRDIAKEAGVSPSTASRALNNNPRISKKMIKKIKKIAAKLDYHPDYTGRNLSKGESNMVGVVFPVTGKSAPANPFHIDLMRGISATLQKKHYELVVAIASTEEKLLAQVKSMFLQSKVRNFLIFYSKEDDAVANYLNKQKLNFVIIGSSDKYRHVNNNNILAGKIATSELCNRENLKHPAFICSENKWSYEKDRCQGYTEYVDSKKIEPTVVLINSKKNNLNEFLKEHSKIDGLIFSDDILYLSCLSNLNMRLPAVCFNSSKLVGLMLGKMLRINLQPRLLGRTAVDILFSEVNSKIVPFKIE